MVALLVVVASALSGCVEDQKAQNVAPEELIVRVFLEDGVAVIRYAGLVNQHQVVPFAGFVDLVLTPASRADWLPAAIYVPVHPSMFTESQITYHEATIPLSKARAGDWVTIEAEATLLDGSVIRGKYATVL